jgi:hypothetical protein
MQLTFSMLRFLAGGITSIIESGNIGTSFISLIMTYTVKDAQERMSNIKTIYLAHSIDNVNCTVELF